MMIERKEDNNLNNQHVEVITVVRKRQLKIQNLSFIDVLPSGG